MQQQHQQQQGTYSVGLSFSCLLSYYICLNLHSRVSPCPRTRRRSWRRSSRNSSSSSSSNKKTCLPSTLNVLHKLPPTQGKNRSLKIMLWKVGALSACLSVCLPVCLQEHSGEGLKIAHSTVNRHHPPPPPHPLLFHRLLLLFFLLFFSTSVNGEFGSVEPMDILLTTQATSTSDLPTQEERNTGRGDPWSLH